MNRKDQMFNVVQNSGTDLNKITVLSKAYELDDGVSDVAAVVAKAVAMIGAEQTPISDYETPTEQTGQTEQEQQAAQKDYSHLTDREILELDDAAPKLARLREIHRLGEAGDTREQRRWITFNAMLKAQGVIDTGPGLDCDGHQIQEIKPGTGDPKEKIACLIELGKAGKSDLQARERFINLQAQLRSEGIEIPREVSQEIGQG